MLISGMTRIQIQVFIIRAKILFFNAAKPILMLMVYQTFFFVK